MLLRRTRTVITRLVLGALFFAQAVVAAAVCDMPDRSPAQVFTQPASMPCHEEPVQNANICLAHCLDADQSADTPQVIIPAWVDRAPITVVVIERSANRAVDVQFVMPWASVPPPRILFQTFLI